MYNTIDSQAQAINEQIQIRRDELIESVQKLFEAFGITDVAKIFEDAMSYIANPESIEGTIEDEPGKLLELSANFHSLITHLSKCFVCCESIESGSKELERAQEKEAENARIAEIEAERMKERKELEDKRMKLVDQQIELNLSKTKETDKLIDLTIKYADLKEKYDKLVGNTE